MQRGIKGNAGCEGKVSEVGFTLIELLVAITILSVIAILSWRGLDQVIRGRAVVSEAMADDRALIQLFNQIQLDARYVASDERVGQPSVRASDSLLQIVREQNGPNMPPLLQVVRYRLVGNTVYRLASPLVRNIGDLRRAITVSDAAPNWQTTTVAAKVSLFNADAFVLGKGWSRQNEGDSSMMNQIAEPAIAPGIDPAVQGSRSVSGLRVQIKTGVMRAPVTRVLLVGE